MSKIYYMGSFPPPYGGVTVKNELLYVRLKDKFDICRKQKFTTLSTVEALLKGRRFILGVGHTKFLLMLTTVMYYLRPKAMSRSIVFAMGGNLADLVEDNPVMIKRLQRYKCVYVEPVGMMNRLQKMGLKNLSLLPNCRVRPATKVQESINDSKSIRCVFFSRISPDKGMDIVLDAAIYDELSKYDVMLLPTRWKFEGIPGVLVEAKIAGIPAIVSDICYNAEIVEDGVSGIVLKDNTAICLTEAIAQLDQNRAELEKLKIGAKQSAERYYIDNYMGDILDKLEESQ